MSKEHEENNERLEKAAKMQKVPLSELDKLIILRQVYAILKNTELVESVNKEIRELLAV